MQEQVTGTHIYFWHDTENDKPKTSVWDVFSEGDNFWLARIFWFAKWRCYSWSSTCKVEGEYGRKVSDIVFEKTCTREIADFCEKLTFAHKNGGERAFLDNYSKRKLVSFEDCEEYDKLVSSE